MDRTAYSAEVRRLPARSRRYAIDLIAIADVAVVVAARAALRGPEEACPRDVMMDADRSASELDVLLSHVSASAIETVCLRMIDSLDRETLMEVGPGRRFVGVNDRALGNAGADEWLSVRLPGPNLPHAPGSAQ